MQVAQALQSRRARESRHGCDEGIASTGIILDGCGNRFTRTTMSLLVHRTIAPLHSSVPLMGHWLAMQGEHATFAARCKAHSRSQTPFRQASLSTVFLQAREGSMRCGTCTCSLLETSNGAPPVIGPRVACRKGRQPGVGSRISGFPSKETVKAKETRKQSRTSRASPERRAEVAQMCPMAQAPPASQSEKGQRAITANCQLLRRVLRVTVTLAWPRNLS